MISNKINDPEYSQDNWDKGVKGKGDNPNSILYSPLRSESGRSEDNYTYKAKYPTQEEIIAFNRKEYKKNEMVDHPNHYGGEDNPYEAIKVIEEWELGFNLGNAVKYISRVDKKNNTLEDLKKASWYINREINKLKNK